MNSIRPFVALLALSGALSAQVNQAPRLARPLPVMHDVKTEAAPLPSTPSVPRERPATTNVESQKPTELPPRVRAVAPARHNQLYFVLEADGLQWVRGRTYKASFGQRGATYIPFLGASAPRNFPIELSLAAASCGAHPIALAPVASVERDGTRVTLERGMIDEVYELGLDSIEQTFVIAERPEGGDLRLFVAIDTELGRSERAEGFEFANEIGVVRYGRAFAREAGGTKVPLDSHAVAGGVEIEVSAEYLARAAYPLTIDPVLFTFALNTTAQDDFEVDVAFDVSTGRRLVVCEEIFSASDHDVFTQLVLSNGMVLVTDYADFTSEHWIGPKCANLNADNQFLVAANASNVSGSTGFVIRGRTVSASSFISGDKFNISEAGTFGEKTFVDIGGDPYDGLGDAYYCVVWQRNFNVNDTDIHARLVQANGALVGSETIMIDNSGATLDTVPSVSRSNGQLGINAVWNIAWHRNTTNGNQGDILGARIAWDGTIVASTYSISVNALAESFANVSPPRDDGTYMVTWLGDFSTDNDVIGALMSGTTVLDRENITALDAPATFLQDQIEVSIDTDGEQFALVYAESYNSSTFDYDIWVSSLHTLDNQIGVTEGHSSLDFSLQRDLRPEIVASYGSGGPRQSYFAAWDESSGSTRDTRAGFYDGLVGGPVTPFCFGDGTEGTCPCANSGAPGSGCANSLDPNGGLLGASGNAKVAADTLQLHASGMPPIVTCTFFQGTSQSSSPSTFGDGLRCVAGSQVRIKSKPTNSAGAADYPVGTEPDISLAGGVPAAGGLRWYQVSYRNAASFCTSATFNITNGIFTVWLP